MNTTYELIDNTEAKQFEFHIGDHIPRIEYIRAKSKIFLTHTEVPKELEGKGIGSAIIKSALEQVEKEDLVLVPLCPFVAGYIKKHPEWKKISTERSQYRII